MHTKTKTFVELNKRGTVDLRENWTVDNNGFVWDENGNPVHVKGEKNLGQVTEMELVNPEDPEDRRTVYTSSGKSVSQAAESYLEHSHDTSVWSEELIELKIKIQPVVLKRLIEDDILSRHHQFEKSVDDDHGPFAEDNDRSESMWGNGKLSEQQWWVWDWIMEAIKSGKEEVQFTYDDPTAFGKANVNWFPADEPVEENWIQPSDSDS